MYSALLLYLNNFISKKVEALNQACGNNGKLQEQIKDLKFKNSELKNQLDGAIWEIENLRQEYDESKNQLTSQWKEICEKNETLEKRIKAFQSENADLKNDMDVASVEIENLRKKYDESKNQLTSQWKETCEKNEALEKRIKCFKSENADLENNLDVASWEIENLRDSSQKLIKDMEKLINRGNWYFSIFIGTYELRHKDHLVYYINTEAHFLPKNYSSVRPSLISLLIWSLILVNRSFNIDIASEMVFRNQSRAFTINIYALLLFL